MKLGVETPAVLVDVARLPLDAIEETARRRPAHRRGRAQQRPRGRPPRPRALPAARAGAARRARRASCATSPPPAATCSSAPAARTSRTSRSRATSARPARAARRARATTATSRSSATRTQCVATHPSDMAVALAALGAEVHVIGPGRRAHDPDPRPAPPARRRARQRDTVLEPGELITRASSCRPPRLAAPLALPQGARPRVVRVRRRLRRRRARRRATARSRDCRIALGASPTSRGARGAPRRRCAARRRRRSASPRPPRPSSPQARAAARQRVQGPARAEPADRDPDRARGGGA